MTTTDPALPLRFEAWETLDWAPAFERQQERWHALQEGRGPHTLAAVEHRPVITIGRRGDATELHIPREALAARGIHVHEADRGGELTYHGPGQLTLYAIIDLRPLGIGPGDLVRALAGAIADHLRTLDLDARYDAERPGLWIEDRKIAAVGMRIRRGVSLHGAALNVHTDLDAFSLFVPCGLPQVHTTSIEKEGRSAPPLMDLGAAIGRLFATRLGLPWEGP